jgi:hypothetical protein
MNTTEQNVIGGVTIPADFKIVRVDESHIECTRPDGLQIFLDRSGDEISQLLNAVRLHGSAEQVIKAVGWIVGIRAAISYSRRYCDELLPALEADLAQALSNIKAIQA